MLRVLHLTIYSDHSFAEVTKCKLKTEIYQKLGLFANMQEVVCVCVFQFLLFLGALFFFLFVSVLFLSKERLFYCF